MRAFFDTSVIVALLLEEPGSGLAREAWRQAEEAWAWDWLHVETEAALVRRKAKPPVWAKWRQLRSRFSWLTLETDDDFARLCTFNRGLGLRASDAGHLFLCEGFCATVADLTLVTFDSEMRAAAEQLGLAVWRAPGA